MVTNRPSHTPRAGGPLSLAWRSQFSNSQSGHNGRYLDGCMPSLMVLNPPTPFPAQPAIRSSRLRSRASPPPPEPERASISPEFNFNQAVYDKVRQIPEGRVASYGDVSRTWVGPFPNASLTAYTLPSLVRCTSHVATLHPTRLSGGAADRVSQALAHGRQRA